MSQRALVTVVRSTGSPAVANAIITGVVSREIRMMQAERDLLRRYRHEDIQRKIEEANRRYAPPHESRIQRAFETVMGLAVALGEWMKESHHVYQ